MPDHIKKKFKTILNKKKFIDSWFWDRYSINPYNGCAFGCVYCDARNGRYRMPSDFENQIIVKTDVADMLDKRIARARTLLPDIVGIGGVTDCYQGIEKSQRNTLAILRVLLKHGYPVHIFTKAPLVLRDAALLDEIGDRSWCAVSFSIPTLDESDGKFLDQRAPTPQRRLGTAAELKMRCPNVLIGVNAIPIVPFMGDRPEELEKLVEAAAKTNVDHFLFGGGLSLGDKAASWFLKKLENYKPELVPKFARLYQIRNLNPYIGDRSPRKTYLSSLHRIILDLTSRFGLNTRCTRYVPEDFRRTNYRIAERLLNTAYRRELLNQDSKDLFWAGQEIQNLTTSLEDCLDEEADPNYRWKRIPLVRRRVIRLMSKLKP